jgi:hypothetical protein
MREYGTFVTVTCLVLGNGNVDQLVQAEQTAFVRAAESAIGAGLPALILVGSQNQPYFVDSTTPRHCQEVVRNPVASAIAAGLQAMGDGLTNRATANCRPGYAGDYDCDINLPPPRQEARPPQVDTICSGGETTSQIVSVTVLERFELLTLEQARLRYDERVSARLRPVTVNAVMQVFGGQPRRPVVTPPPTRRPVVTPPPTDDSDDLGVPEFAQPN